MHPFKSHTYSLFRLLTILGTGTLLMVGVIAQEPDTQESSEAEGSEQTQETSGSEGKTADEETSSQTPQEDESELRQFTPSDQIRADSEVTFPADI